MQIIVISNVLRLRISESFMFAAGLMTDINSRHGIDEHAKCRTERLAT